jgi:hypothetical protein
MSINGKDTAWALGFANSLAEGKSPLMASAIDAPMAEARISAQILEDPEDDDADPFVPELGPF